MCNMMRKKPPRDSVMAINARLGTTFDSTQQPTATQINKTYLHRQPTSTCLVRYPDGSQTEVPLNKFKPSYSDEYTGETMDQALAEEAITNEVKDFNEKVWRTTTLSEAGKDPEGKSVGGRWVMRNKGDAASPKIRCRFVATEINTHDDHSFYATTPPLEAQRLLCAMFSKWLRRKGQPLHLSMVDVTKAYFNAKPLRSLYVKVPRELGLPHDVAGKLERCCFGTRNARDLWEETHAAVL